MIVLSLFDGMSCCQMALEAAGIPVEKYYSSEIEIQPQKATKTVYPNTIFLGDVRLIKIIGSVDSEKQKQLENEGYNFIPGDINLLGGGSPCQSFSFAGKRKGMVTKTVKSKSISEREMEEHNDAVRIAGTGKLFYELEDFVTYKSDIEYSSQFESIEILTLEHYLELKEQCFQFEGQSYLFWEYMRLLKEIQSVNPDVKFLLENVVMSEKWKTILTRAIGINPIEINSALVSAQNRKRLYWTNIGAEPDGLFGDLYCKIKQPKDRNVLLKDILEIEVSDRYFISQQRIDTILKSERKSDYVDETTPKYNTVLCHTAKNPTDMQYIVHNMMPRSGDPLKGGVGHLIRKDGKTYCLDTGNTNGIEIPFCAAMRGRNSDDKEKTEQQIEPREDGKTNCLTSVEKDNLVVGGTLRTHNDGKGFRKISNDKSGTVPARGREDGSGQNVVKINSNIRRLTPRECGRLQTVPEHILDIMLTCGISDSQLYKMFGNGWTIEVIAHIYSYL